MSLKLLERYLDIRLVCHPAFRLAFGRHVCFLERFNWNFIWILSSTRHLYKKKKFYLLNKIILEWKSNCKSLFFFLFLGEKYLFVKNYNKAKIEVNKLVADMLFFSLLPMNVIRFSFIYSFLYWFPLSRISWLIFVVTVKLVFPTEIKRLITKNVTHTHL